jgi:trehalose 6-phosphate phosphatase
MNLPDDTLAHLPPLTPQTALFLDFDGTLVELAPQPDAVVIPPLLTSTLAGLYRQLGGALALVSGRCLMDLDTFVAPLQLPAAVEHGAQRRNAEGLLMSAPAIDLGLALRAAEDLVQRYPALRLERKLLALSLHYRHAPELENVCLQALRQAVACSVGVELMQGKCVIDVKPAGVSKGAAIAAFMAEAPFAGRTPVFAGDDVTDEDGFAQVQRLGGHAVKVGAGPSCARYRCASVIDLARWLQSPLSALHVPDDEKASA